ncbi:hypothetical protein CBR_g41208 [Chara braunii]|uniref:Uncharacterized protein n=1 Tax=Chara braunii TaxID=69332 RepID=A0A388K2P9_CHABU|nr:hypothetical protein CBR_g41208 [Chara braunii]|eukprot:GBG64289.1 hypothetical protein CBR_g41208 [Chara braunii]
MMTMMTWHSGDDLDDDVDDGQVTTSKQGGSGGFEPLRYQCNEREAEGNDVEVRSVISGARLQGNTLDWNPATSTLTVDGNAAVSVAPDLAVSSSAIKVHVRQSTPDGETVLRQTLSGAWRGVDSLSKSTRRVANKEDKVKDHCRTGLQATRFASSIEFDGPVRVQTAVIPPTSRSGKDHRGRRLHVTSVPNTTATTVRWARCGNSVREDGHLHENSGIKDEYSRAPTAAGQPQLSSKLAPFHFRKAGSRGKLCRGSMRDAQRLWWWWKELSQHRSPGRKSLELEILSRAGFVWEWLDKDWSVLQSGGPVMVTTPHLASTQVCADADALSIEFKGSRSRSASVHIQGGLRVSACGRQKS